jgi:hypothetical protein
MATYFTTTQQLNKLLASHKFNKARLSIVTKHISKTDFEEVFIADETLAYSEQFEIEEGDELLFTDHIAQSKALAEVVKR